MNIASFNWVDYLIVSIIVFSILISLVRGFVREAVSLAIWAAAILLAMHFSESVSAAIKDQIASDQIRFIVAFAVIFIAILVVGIFVNAFISALVSKTGMGAVDRLAGMVFGCLRGVLIVGAILAFINGGVVVKSHAIKKSQLAYEFKPLTSWIKDFMPQKVAELNSWLDTSKHT